MRGRRSALRIQIRICNRMNICAMKEQLSDVSLLDILHDTKVSHGSIDHYCILQ